MSAACRSPARLCGRREHLRPGWAARCVPWPLQPAAQPNSQVGAQRAARTRPGSRPPPPPRWQAAVREAQPLIRPSHPIARPGAARFVDAWDLQMQYMGDHQASTAAPASLRCLRRLPAFRRRALGARPLLPLPRRRCSIRCCRGLVLLFGGLLGRQGLQHHGPLPALRPLQVPLIPHLGQVWSRMGKAMEGWEGKGREAQRVSEASGG